MARRRVAKRLEALAGRLHGVWRRAPDATRDLHLTLAFVGDVDRDRLPLEAVGDAVGGPGFELPIDAVGYWPHNRIVWAGSTACPVARHGWPMIWPRPGLAGFEIENAASYRM